MALRAGCKTYVVHPLPLRHPMGLPQQPPLLHCTAWQTPPRWKVAEWSRPRHQQGDGGKMGRCRSCLDGHGIRLSCSYSNLSQRETQHFLKRKKKINDAVIGNICKNKIFCVQVYSQPSRMQPLHYLATGVPKAYHSHQKQSVQPVC